VKKVMVVDDDREFLEEISEVLERAGYEAVLFCTGEEAFQAALTGNLDVIILDLKIEGGSGFKTADELRRSQKTAHIPLIAITGIYIEEEYRLLMKACGFKHYLQKPINPLDLIAAIEESKGPNLCI